MIHNGTSVILDSDQRIQLFKKKNPNMNYKKKIDSIYSNDRNIRAVLTCRAHSVFWKL